MGAVMASDQFSRALLAGVGVLGLTAVLVGATFINEADAETRGDASQPNALIVISSNTHLVLRDRNLQPPETAGQTMVCGSVVTTPIFAVGFNCQRV